MNSIVKFVIGSVVSNVLLCAIIIFNVCYNQGVNIPDKDVEITTTHKTDKTEVDKVNSYDSKSVISMVEHKDTHNDIKENKKEISSKSDSNNIKPNVTNNKVIAVNQITNVNNVSTKNMQSNNIKAYYNNICLSENDMNMMCTIVSSEAGYCDDMAQKAIAHTILNRFNDDRFPNTMYEITTQENQYTAIHSYFDGQYREGLYPGSELWNHSMQLCYEALNEWDFTGGAFAYYNPQMIGYNAWFESLQFTYQNQYARFFTF